MRKQSKQRKQTHALKEAAQLISDTHALKESARTQQTCRVLPATCASKACKHML